MARSRSPCVSTCVCDSYWRAMLPLLLCVAPFLQAAAETTMRATAKRRFMRGTYSIRAPVRDAPDWTAANTMRTRHRSSSTARVPGPCRRKRRRCCYLVGQANVNAMRRVVNQEGSATVAERPVMTTDSGSPSCRGARSRFHRSLSRPSASHDSTSPAAWGTRRAEACGYRGSLPPPEL